MSIKIAVGSSDGFVIDQHFGSGKLFYIFEILDEGNYKLIEKREVQTEVVRLVLKSCSNNENTGCNSRSNSVVAQDVVPVVMTNLVCLKKWI